MGHQAVGGGIRPHRRSEDSSLCVRASVRACIRACIPAVYAGAAQEMHSQLRHSTLHARSVCGRSPGFACAWPELESTMFVVVVPLAVIIIVTTIVISTIASSIGVGNLLHL